MLTVKVYSGVHIKRCYQRTSTVHKKLLTHARDARVRLARDETTEPIFDAFYRRCILNLESIKIILTIIILL